jgi:hypothetical protein
LRQGAKLAVDRVDSPIHLLGQLEQLGDRGAPDRRHSAALEQLGSVPLRQPRVAEAKPELGEQAEDPVASGGPCLHQVRPAPKQLAQRPILGRGQPELGDEVSPAKLRQDPGVDLVGLQASGATSLTLRAWATCTSQPVACSWSRTQTAPLIISTAATTSLPNRKTSFASPSSSAEISPSLVISPPSPIAQ